MFPSRLLRGIDLAIEFATLGEYGLEPAPTPVAAPAFRVDLSGIGGSAGAAGSSGRLAPSTPAARRLEAARAAATPVARPPLSAPLPSRRLLRSSTFGPPHRAGPRMRVRAGAAPPRPQPCLVADGERSSQR